MEHERQVKDHCSLFPEYWFGTYIGGCCKIHDKKCGTKAFHRCLKTKVNMFSALLITFGGWLGCMVKYPKMMIQRMFK